MSTWICLPAKRPATEAQAFIAKWSGQGYKVAIWRDTGDEPVLCDYLRYGDYPGYARACNSLIKDVLSFDAESRWVVCAGDDTDPDPNKRADEIAAECSAWFGRKFIPGIYGEPLEVTLYGDESTFGVMQPTGDRFAEGSIDRIAGSPWIGREFCERAYGGRGPYWHEYRHMFLDEEIQCVAQKMGVFWQRPDLIHLHHHFMRKSADIHSPAIHAPVPPHLIEANSPVHWSRYQAMFLGRKAAGFPGHEVAA